MTRSDLLNLFNINIPEIYTSGNEFNENGMESLVKIIYKRLIW